MLSVGSNSLTRSEPKRLNTTVRISTAKRNVPTGSRGWHITLRTAKRQNIGHGSANTTGFIERNENLASSGKAPF